MVDTLRREPDDFSSALDRRARLFRLARLVLLALVAGYFFAPYDVRAVIPVWLLFLAALGLEVEFFLGGWRQARQGAVREPPDRGPQPRDLEELGAHQDEFEPVRLFPSEWYRAPAAPRRYWRYVVEGVAALAVVAGILFYAARPHGWEAVSAADQARAEEVFSREASLIAGHEAEVRCDDRREKVGFVQDADGIAEVGGRLTYLTPEICDALYQLAFKDRVQSFSRTARAIAVLAHEAQHLRGVRNEGLANCYGFQTGVDIGVHLGLPEGEARAMMREQLASNASDSAGNMRYRVPAGCRTDGPQDLKPAEPKFP